MRTLIKLPVLTLVAALGLTTVAGNAYSHQGEDHGDGVEVEVPTSVPDGPFPIDIGGEFNLIDHNGERFSSAAVTDKHMLVFFGYINCKIMCSTTLGRLSQTLDHMGARVEQLTPVVITVDPNRDTPEAMKEGLSRYHPELLGLTGTKEELAVAYNAYKIKPEVVGEDWEGQPILSHSSWMYLMGPDGEIRTQLPPIVKPEIMSEIILKYIEGTG